MRAIGVIALVLSVCACTTVQAPPPTVAEDDLIASVVFTDLIKTNRQFQNPFLCLFKRDPNERVLAAVRSGVPGPVEPCSFSAPGPISPVHRETGQRGIIYTITDITRISKDEVLVEADYFCGNLCAAGYQYRLARSLRGEWRIVKAEGTWIS